MKLVKCGESYLDLFPKFKALFEFEDESEFCEFIRRWKELEDESEE